MTVKRRNVLQLIGLGALGLAAPAACRKTRRVKPPAASRAKVEKEVYQLLNKIESNPDIRTVKFQGKELLLGHHDLARVINSALAKVKSKKRVYFTREVDARTEILYGEISQHQKIDHIDILVFEENEKINTFRRRLFGRSNILWRLIMVSKKGLSPLWESMGKGAFEFGNRFAKAMFKIYGIRNSVDFRLNKKQALNDLAECVKHHELTHHNINLMDLAQIGNKRFRYGTNYLNILLEVRAELGVLNHIADLKDKSKSMRLASLWAFYAYDSRMPNKIISFLILAACMKKDQKSGRIRFDLNRLTTLTKKFTNKLEAAIKSIGRQIQPGTTEYQIHSIMKNEASAAIRELFNYPEIGGQNAPYSDVIHSAHYLTQEKLNNLGLGR
jgi:hypothetical protein